MISLSNQFKKQSFSRVRSRIGWDRRSFVRPSSRGFPYSSSCYKRLDGFLKLLDPLTYLENFQHPRRVREQSQQKLFWTSPMNLSMASQTDRSSGFQFCTFLNDPLIFFRIDELLGVSLSCGNRTSCKVFELFCENGARIGHLWNFLGKQHINCFILKTLMDLLDWENPVLEIINSHIFSKDKWSRSPRGWSGRWSWLKVLNWEIKILPFSDLQCPVQDLRNHELNVCFVIAFQSPFSNQRISRLVWELFLKITKVFESLFHDVVFVKTEFSCLKTGPCFLISNL